MPVFKRPLLRPGPLDELMAALHELHLAAGYPSTRVLESDLGSAVVSHTTIHKVFTAGRLPTWGVVEVLTEALAGRARRDKSSEVERIRVLWTQAADNKLDSESSSTKPAAPSGDLRETRHSHFISEILPNALEKIEAAGLRKNVAEIRVSTGFDYLDELTGGWPLGGLVIVSGRPGSGKTSLMLSFALTAAFRDKLFSLFASFEEDEDELQIRMLSSSARVPLQVIRNGLMTDDDWGRTARTMASLADAPLAICAPKSLSLDQVVTETSDFARKYELRAVFVDGLGSFIDPDKDNYISALESSLRSLKKLAANLKLPVIVCLPSSRPKPDYESPRIERLTGGEVIEHIADIIIMLERTDQDDYQSPYAGEADLVVIKNKFGPQGTASVAFQGHYSRLVDMGPRLSLRSAFSSGSLPDCSASPNERASPAYCRRLPFRC